MTPLAVLAAVEPVGPRRRRRHHHAQRVHRAQQQRDEVGRHRKDPLTQPVEQVLERVTEAHEGVEAEGGAVSLQGVGEAEHGAQKLGVVAPHLEGDEDLLHHGQALLRFAEESLDDGVAFELEVRHPFISIGRTQAAPVRTWNTSLRPRSPPTSSPTNGMAAAASCSRAISTLRAPSDH